MRPHLSLLAASLLLAGPAVAQDSTLVRDGQGWLRVEHGMTYRVQPDVLSLKAAPGVVLGELLAQVGLSEASVLRANRLGIVDLKLPAGVDPVETAAALRATGGVDFAEEQTFGSYTGTPNDALFAQQWSKNNTGQSGGTVDADVDAVEAWDIEDGDPSVVVAILDSGSDWTHEDLVGAIWANPGEVENGVDSDNNGYIDDVRGWDFDFDDNDPNGLFNHGTMVASVVGATADNGVGVAGMAGGAEDGDGCRLMICNVGSFSPDAAVLDDAILYAMDNGARVITMSLSIGTSAAVDAAVATATAAGLFIDNAAGNNGSFGVSYPSTLPDVVAVASSNRFDGISSFSSVGPEVDVTAPGEDVLMADLGGGYTTSDGTSFASPHVAGLAALCFSANPALTAAQVRTIIESTCDDIGATAEQMGNGRINAAAALALAAGGVLGEVLPYGAGLAGTGGTIPDIDPRGGVPNLGDNDFAVQLTNAQGNAPAYFLLGFDAAALPFKGGTIHVDIAGPSFIAAFTTSNNGGAIIPINISSDPIWEGESLYTQFVVVDAGGPLGFAMTEGLELVIGT